MKKIFSLIILGIFLISLVGSITICVDKTPPSAPSNLAVTSSGTNIILTWNPATDIPECSGVDYYNIIRNGVVIAEHITALTYTNIGVPYGTYSYGVYAVDKIGHNGGPAIKNDVVLSAPSSGGSGGGGGGGGTRVVGGEPENSYVCSENWQCDDWSSCENGEQTRTCIDTNACGTSIEKPAIVQECEEEQTQSTNFLTGAVTGITNFAKSPTGTATILGLVTVAGAIAYFSFKKRFVKKPENPEKLDNEEEKKE